MGWPYRLELEKVLGFVYGTAYFWLFRYGKDVVELDDLAPQVEHLNTLAARARSAGDGLLSTAPVDPGPLCQAVSG